MSEIVHPYSQSPDASQLQHMAPSFNPHPSYSHEDLPNASDPSSPLRSSDSPTPDEPERYSKVEQSSADDDYSGRPHIKGWPTTPKALEDISIFNQLLEQSTVVWDAICAILGVVFLVLAFLSVRLDQKIVAQAPWGLNVLSASKYGPTVFPILFAMVVGKTLRNLARYRIERGSQLGELEQLLGSYTLMSTIETQLEIRIFGVTPVLLVLLWALSPLGGQASLRVLNIVPTPNSTLVDVRYASSQWTDNSITIQSAGQSYDKIVMDTVVANVMMQPSAAKRGAMDLWGNIKIPMLERLGDVLQPDQDGWWTVPDSNRYNVTYASMVGLPVRDVPENGNTTLYLENSYFNIECPQLVWQMGQTKLSNISDPVTGNEWMGLASMNGASVFNTSNYGRTWQISTNVTSQNRTEPKEVDVRWIKFESRDADGITTALCTVRNTYIEMEVFCEGPKCTVPRARASKKQNPPSSWTPYELGMNFYYGAAGLTGFLPARQSASSTVIQSYFINPADPFTLTRNRNWIPSLAIIGREAMGQRLSELLNTYWIANTMPYDLQGSSPATMKGTLGVNYRTVVGTNEKINVKYVYYRAWFAVLVGSSTVLILVGIAGAVVGAFCHGPDILGRVSSLTRDNPYTPTPPGGSGMLGGDRARLLRYMKVRLGDVHSESDIGHIAIGATDLQYVGRLKKGRRYF